MPAPLTWTDEDGVEFAVDLDRISGWDAIAYRQVMGEHIETAVLALLQKPEIAMAVDRVVVRWLWVRQNVNATATIPSVALQVPALVPPDEPEESPGDGGEDSPDDDQGEH